MLGKRNRAEAGIDDEILERLPSPDVDLTNCELPELDSHELDILQDLVASNSDAQYFGSPFAASSHDLDA